MNRPIKFRQGVAAAPTAQPYRGEAVVCLLTQAALVLPQYGQVFGARGPISRTAYAAIGQHTGGGDH